MSYNVYTLLSHISDMANEAIDLEDFQSSLEELIEDYNYAVEKEHTEADEVAAGVTGGALGAALGEIGYHAYKEKYKNIKEPLSGKRLLIKMGAVGGALGVLNGIHYRLKKRREARLKKDRE